MNRLKNMIAWVAALALFAGTPSFAYDKLYHTYAQTEALAPGVTLTNEQRMTSAGWFNINLVTIDLTNPSVESTVLLPDFISEKAPLTALASSEENVVAAINGDFFDTQGKSTLGMVVKDGTYITSSIHDDRFYTYLQMKDGRSYIAKVLGEATKFSNTGHTIDITYKNKPYLQYDRAIMFDRSWGNASIGNTNTEPVLEVVVSNGKIISMALDPAPQRIPDDGYIISAVGTMIPEIFSNYALGDEVTLKNGAFMEHIDQAIGGGAKILTDGIPGEDFSLNISGRHPRSALGFSADNKTLYLVAVDGRHTNFTGMTQTELAYLMAEAGAYNAINLDGGGSTELVAKTLGSSSPEIVNTPSDGTERRIHNGIGVINTAPQGSLDKLILDMPTENIFSGSLIEPSILGIDENMHAVSFDKESIVYTTEGVNCTIDSRGITPLESGTLIIRAKLGSAVGSTQVKVLGEPVGISVYPETARLKTGEPLDIQLTGYDAEGFSAPLSLSDVFILQSGLKGRISNAKYVVSEPGSGYIRFTLGEAEAFMSIGVGESESPLYDFESDFGRFVSYPETVSGSYALTDFAYAGNKGGTLSYNFKNDTATRAAYVQFGDSGLALPQNTSRINVWAYGDYANGHWLRAKLTDSSGTVHTLDLTKSVDWTGWKQIGMDLPADVDFKTLNRLYLVETDPSIRDAGVIVFDDLSVLTTAAPPENLPAATSPYIFETLTAEASDFILNLESAPSDQDSGLLTEDRTPEDALLLKLNNAGSQLSRTASAGGWEALLSLMPSDSVNDVIISLNSTYSFKNDFDKKLFEDTLEDLRKNTGTRIMVLSPETTNTITLMNGVWYIHYDKTSTAIMLNLENPAPRVSVQARVQEPAE